jgi:hypothetical protein
LEPAHRPTNIYGLVYFIASILCDLRGDDAHRENTGCVNDFWWDKRGIDVGMRAAFICADCRRRFAGDKALLADVERLLDLVSTASRAGRDVLTISNATARGSDAGFDAFMCHNGEDKPAVRKIKQHRNNRTTAIDELAQKSPDLHVLPRSTAIRANEYTSSSDLRNLAL